MSANAGLGGSGRNSCSTAGRSSRSPGGDVIFGPGVAQRALRFFSAGAPAPADQPFPELTSRERQILDMLAAGGSNTAIGKRLGIAPKTVANNVSAIFSKLQVADRSRRSCALATPVSATPERRRIRAPTGHQLVKMRCTMANESNA